MKPLFTNETTSSNWGGPRRKILKIVCFVLELMAFFVQLSSIPILIIPYSQYIHANNTHTLNYVTNISTAANVSKSQGFVIDNHLERVQIVGAMLLCSLSWWENFIDTVHGSGWVSQKILKLKFDLQESRPYISLCVSVFKIATSVLTSIFLMQEHVTFDFSHLKRVGTPDDVKSYSSILALVLSGFLGYYLAYTVCKLQMQKFSFSIPCILSTPIAIIAVAIECNTNNKYLSKVSNYTLTTSCDDDIETPWFHLPLEALWLISFYWIGRHIWFPTQERLAKVDRYWL